MFLVKRSFWVSKKLAAKVILVIVLLPVIPFILWGVIVYKLVDYLDDDTQPDEVIAEGTSSDNTNTINSLRYD